MNNQGPQLGDVLAGYRLERVVHRNDTTTVFQAVNAQSGRHVAIKVRPAADDHADPPPLDPATAARLDGHPHIIRVIERGRVHGKEYRVEPFVAGVSLRDLIDRNGPTAPMPATEAMPLLAQLADAVDVAHKCGAIDDVDVADVLVEMSGRDRIAVLDVGDGHPATDGALVGIAESFSTVALSLLSGQPSRRRARPPPRLIVEHRVAATVTAFGRSDALRIDRHRHHCRAHVDQDAVRPDRCVQPPTVPTPCAPPPGPQRPPPAAPLAMVAPETGC